MLPSTGYIKLDTTEQMNNNKYSIAWMYHHLSIHLTCFFLVCFWGKFLTVPIHSSTPQVQFVSPNPMIQHIPTYKQ